MEIWSWPGLMACLPMAPGTLTRGLFLLWTMSFLRAHHLLLLLLVGAVCACGAGAGVCVRMVGYACRGSAYTFPLMAHSPCLQ